MTSRQKTETLGLELSLQHPAAHDLVNIPPSRDEGGNVVYPEVDADGDHVHFEMVPMAGDSLLWLTIRRGTAPELASQSLRKLADLIEQHGMHLLNLLEGREGSFSSEGHVISGPLRLAYDEHGDIIFPPPPSVQDLQSE